MLWQLASLDMDFPWPNSLTPIRQTVVRAMLRKAAPFRAIAWDERTSTFEKRREGRGYHRVQRYLHWVACESRWTSGIAVACLTRSAKSLDFEKPLMPSSCPAVPTRLIRHDRSVLIPLKGCSRSRSFCAQGTVRAKSIQESSMCRN